MVISLNTSDRSPDRLRYVMRLQACLKRLGYKIEVDGVFGAGTQGIVKTYQMSKDLVGDGVVGPRTWGILLAEAYQDVTVGDAFFNALRNNLFKGGFTSAQVDGINLKFEAFQSLNLTVPEMAYLYATSYHETGIIRKVNGKSVMYRSMQPVQEMGKGAGRRYGRHIKMSGRPYPRTMPIYYGRGDVQLTWYENYDEMGKLLGIDLLVNPDLALDTQISAKILVLGTRHGKFGRKLGSFIDVEKGQVDYFNARRCVNILDRAELIAGYAMEFELALLQK